MMKRLLTLLAIAVVIVSCADPVTKPEESNPFSGLNTISATVGDRFIESENCTLSVAEREGEILKFKVVGLSFSGHLIFEAYVTKVGTYTLGDGTDSSSFDYESVSPVYDPCSTGDGATIKLIVDHLDRSGKRIKGRFSGSLVDWKSTIIVVKDGVFEGKWD